MQICVPNYAEQSEMQDPGLWAKEMENVNCFLHLVSPLVGKRSQPGNSMLVRKEGDAIG